MDVVIFGVGQQASISWYALTQESGHRVVAFTVDAAFRTSEALHGLPVVAFEELARTHPPGRVAMLAPLSYRRMNRTRMEKYAQAKALGYGFVSHVSPRAVVWPNLKLGENCIVHAGAIVHPFVEIGDNCLIMAGSNVAHHSRVGDHCYIAPGAVVGGGVEIGEACVLGLNSTVRNGLRVAPRCLIGVGAVLTADTERDGVYVGVPARRRPKSVDEAPETGW